MTVWAGVDWSQAPTWATHWAMDEDQECLWYGAPSYVNGFWFPNYQLAPTFNYTGEARDSLTVRPAQTTKGQDA